MPSKKSAAHAAPMPAEKPEPAPTPPPVPRRTIEALLADKSFDPDGLVRMKLAERSVQGGGEQLAPADLVDDDGTPIPEA